MSKRSFRNEGLKYSGSLKNLESNSVELMKKLTEIDYSYRSNSAPVLKPNYNIDANLEVNSEIHYDCVPKSKAIECLVKNLGFDLRYNKVKLDDDLCECISNTNKESNHICNPGKWNPLKMIDSFPTNFKNFLLFMLNRIFPRRPIINHS